MTSTSSAAGVLLGHARTPEERTAEACLLRVDEWRGREVRYAPVTGGLMNLNWRVEVAGDETPYFLKVPGAGTETMIDRGNAHVAAERAAALGISPRIVHFDPVEGVEIIEFLEGYRACTNGDLKRWEIAEDVLRLHDAFYSIEALPVTKTIFDMVDEHLVQAAELGAPLPAWATPLLREYEAAKGAYLASGLDLVPCHNDPMPGNFLIHPDRPMRLVDFEFASNNERSYDLAVTFTEFFYDEPTVLACVEATYGRASWDVVARAQVSSALADVKWGLWGCVNHHLNTAWDFDYHKYGVWKLARARAKVADPRWASWLHAL
ncbi:choline kinase family protein [Nocardioides sp. GY 10127]|uniref:choline kinase family protein n=1 Tax=Nocardioides sp. GY 10127 TaxID=2569762 RepID=UPI0010A7915E|nr:choline kinase family protein [Nocardioides sp. GY 10127]TIC82764.1 choline/ethanolamine kinase--aminoglycoside phosphotransferase [Nocardioides sp. GY 10127]